MNDCPWCQGLAPCGNAVCAQLDAARSPQATARRNAKLARLQSLGREIAALRARDALADRIFTSLENKPD